MISSTAGFRLAGFCLLLPALIELARAQTLYQINTVAIDVSPLSHNGLNTKTWPHNVQRFTAKDLVSGIADALNEKAMGVSLVNSQDNPYQPTTLYHGFEISPIQGTPAGLSVYVNGARFNQAFGNVALWSTLPAEAIKSLTLEDGNPVFGLNALGGAINLQMKNGFLYQGGEAEVSGGSFDQAKGIVQ